MTLSESLRNLVIERAMWCCEYCRVHEIDNTVEYHVDHIIAVAHGGLNHESNLVYSCSRCNQAKGTNVAGADPETGEPTFLYHPRRHFWREHFQVARGMIYPLTPEGRATLQILKFNDRLRLIQRNVLADIDRFPCPELADL